jgi:hypothetical protein
MSMQVDRAVRAFSRPYAVQDDRLAWTSFLGSYAAYLGTLALAVWAAHLHWALALPLIVVNAFAGVRAPFAVRDAADERPRGGPAVGGDADPLPGDAVQP